MDKLKIRFYDSETDQEDVTGFLLGVSTATRFSSAPGGIEAFTPYPVLIIAADDGRIVEVLPAGARVIK